MIIYEVSGRGLLRDEQFWFRPKYSTALQDTRLVERVSRNFDEKRLTGAVLLYVAKDLDTVWDGLLYNLKSLIFPRCVLPNSHIHCSSHGGLA
jgi:hypothetical protein